MSEELFKTGDLRGTPPVSKAPQESEYEVAVSVAFQGTATVAADSKKQAIKRLARALKKGQSVSVAFPQLGTLGVSKKTSKITPSLKKTRLK